MSGSVMPLITSLTIDQILPIASRPRESWNFATASIAIQTEPDKEMQGSLESHDDKILDRIPGEFVLWDELRIRASSRKRPL
jgi:hypothetical protein